MKYTLLEMTQDILSSMDSDEVNSITDTTESEQVSRIIRACYFDVISNNLPEDTTVYQLQASGDSTKPVLMTRPEDVHTLTILKYNKIADGEEDPRFVELTPLHMNAFFDMTHSLTLSDDDVASMTHTLDGASITFLYRTDKAPDYFTCVDDHTFLFDSYDSEVDTTLQASKTFCIGEKEKTFTLSDNYEIDLDEAQHIWLLNEAKALAFAEMKQATHPKAEQTAKRQRIKAQKAKYVMNDAYLNYTALPNYGRGGRMSARPFKLH